MGGGTKTCLIKISDGLLKTRLISHIIKHPAGSPVSDHWVSSYNKRHMSNGRNMCVDGGCGGRWCEMHSVAGWQHNNSSASVGTRKTVESV